MPKTKIVLKAKKTVKTKVKPRMKAVVKAKIKQKIKIKSRIKIAKAKVKSKAKVAARVKNKSKARITPKTKSVPKTKQKREKLIGKISHYFDNIKVAVVDLKGGLKIGETVRIAGGEKTDFTQTIKSMESEHKKIEKAKKGDSIGVKIKEKVREGYKVYKFKI
jgi:putative protease